MIDASILAGPSSIAENLKTHLKSTVHGMCEGAHMISQEGQLKAKGGGCRTSAGERDMSAFKCERFSGVSTRLVQPGSM